MEDVPRTKTQVMLHLVTRAPKKVEKKEEREVTQAGLINDLLPIETYVSSKDGKLRRVALTDLRITRAWCMGRNVERIIDKIRQGEPMELVRELTCTLCGLPRVMFPSAYRDDDDD